MADLKDRLSLRKYGKFSGPETIMKLKQLAKQFKGQEYRYIDPETAAMLLKKDWGVPLEQTGFYPSPRHFLETYPQLTLDEAQALSGIYFLPQRVKEFGIPLEYLKGHETQHQISSGLRGKALPEYGQGNVGYMPVRGKPSEFETYSGIENWLLGYPPSQRMEERAAHKRGLSWMGGFPPKYYPTLKERLQKRKIKLEERI